VSKLEAFKQQMEALHRAYVQQLPHKVQQIEELWRTVCKDAQDKATLQLIYHLVHKLSGSGPTFGFTTISERAECLEEVIKRVMRQGVVPSQEEKRRGDQAVASLKLIAAAATAGGQGFSPLEAQTEDWTVPKSKDAPDRNSQYLILVADDEAFLRKKLVLILREAGFRVEEAENGLAALTQVQIQRPHVILMDYLMPVMDGVEAIRRLRLDPQLKNIPVLLLTTHQKINDVQRVFDCDVNGYLAKPFDPMEVIQQVNACLPTETAIGDHATNGHEAPKKQILIADDYVLYRRKVALILKHAGFHVVEADNGMMALKQAKKLHPDLILMDVMMPVMDGLEAIRRIREDESLRHVPIIMLTTSVRMKDVPIALASGADAYISKPQSAEQIVEKVRTCLAV